MASQPTDRGVPPGMLIRHRVGGWLPRDHRVLRNWLANRIEKVDRRARDGIPKDLAPVIQEFQTLIETDPVIYMGFHQMFEQVPTKPPYDNDPTGKPQVRDYKLMLSLFNDILLEAPQYRAEDGGLIGFPINAILDWPMGTPAGYAMFTNEKVNAQFHKMFDVWTEFLTSPESRVVLGGSGGWLEAIDDFVATYQCDPSDPYYGFKSWDDFFTRKFRDGVRPNNYPEDKDIISACESTVYKLACDVQERDSFWLKGQPYSLADMLNYDDNYIGQFVGGKVYQAFLSALEYHRWHSPVKGTIERIVHVPGTYYAESPTMGFGANPDESSPDPAAPDLSQAFITAMAARAIVYIRADYAPIGLMCFIAVGMSEVSSCEVTVKEGDAVDKGQEIGMFHFGGSTHCLLFRPETNVQFTRREEEEVPLHGLVGSVTQ